MMSLAALKDQIDIKSVIREAGVNLKASGSRYVGSCPFHDDRTPSFNVYPDGYYHCFGCGEHGDAINFIEKLHGLDFKDACRHLGLDIRKRLTIKARKEISKRKHIRKLVDNFRWWERTAVHTFSILVRATHMTTRNMTPELFEKYGQILDPLPYWEYCLDILTFGDDEQKYLLYLDCKKNEMTYMQRNLLFEPDFDYRKWLKDTLGK